jgi:hypothetical protein
MENVQTLPYIKLTTPHGQPKFLADYRGLVNLVIVFAHEDTRTLLHDMAQQPRQFHNADSQVIVIVPQASEMPGTPFTVLLDEQAKLHAAFSPAGVVIADRYGEIITHYEDPPSTSDLLDYLEYLELQCPECGHIEWVL